MDAMVNIICLYRSTSQNTKEFETFVKNLELNLEFNFSKKPYLTVVIRGVNPKSYNWYKGDKTTTSVSKPEIMTSHHGLTQIINGPIKIL